LSHLNINGKRVDEPIDIANHVNDFFTSVGPNLDRSIPQVNHISCNKYLNNRDLSQFIIAHISNDNVIKIIQSLSSKGTGPASIPLNLLKTAADLIPIPLCHIINSSFSSGIFPDI